MINFNCDRCHKDVDKCKCSDLEERYKARFWGSVLYDQAMAVVEKVRAGKKAA